MMAPEAVASAPALERTAAAAASSDANAGNEGRPPLRWPFSSRERQDRAGRAAAVLAEEDETGISSAESEDASSHSSGKREHVEHAAYHSSEAVSSASEAVVGSAGPEQVEASSRRSNPPTVSFDTLLPRAT